MEMQTPAIGGKDSMSGTFEDIDVPPTLVSFAVATSKVQKLITSEFKNAGGRVCVILPQYDDDMLINYAAVKKTFNTVYACSESKQITAAYAIGFGGVAEAVAKMCFGNKLGFTFNTELGFDVYEKAYGGFVLELADDASVPEGALLIGSVCDNYSIVLNSVSYPLEDIIAAWQKPLSGIYPIKTAADESALIIPTIKYNSRSTAFPSVKVKRPKVLIPVFPGTNCEYDCARRFEKAGADAEIFVIRNLTPKAVEESVVNISKSINSSQIVMFPGGFSGGDEPDGSGKFIAAFFRNPLVKEAMTELLDTRKGLALGICNGFQALIKLGLLPFGQICDTTEDSPTLTFNAIGRHQSMLVNTRIASVNSPWLANVNVGEIHTLACSHGEGRFVCNEAWLNKLEQNGQIATQYCDHDGTPTSLSQYNPNNSLCAVEGILSPDGRVFGKMCHSERISNNVYMNVPGDKDQLLFEAGVRYFNV